MFKRFAHHGVVVSDLDKSVAFYQDFLPMKLQRTYEVAGEALEEATGLPGAHIKVAVLKIFDGHVLKLMQYLCPRGKQNFEADFWDVGASHRTIMLDSIQETYEKLRARGIKFISPPVQPVPESDPAVMFTYLRDPDGLIVELLQNSIFHCALTAVDLDRAVAFYRDVLGFKIWKSRDLKGKGIGEGIGAPGVTLKCSHMTLDNSESIELFGFTNKEGKQRQEIELNDVGCSYVAFDVDDVQQTYEELRAKGIKFLSRPVHLIAEEPEAMMVYMRDHDGYVLELRSGA